MGKKKVKPNAFSVFMREYLNKEKRAGRTYRKEEWSSVVKPFYDRLSSAEKETYKRMAKNLPTRVVNQPAKFTSQGIPLEVVDREQREIAEKERFMKRKMKNIIENGFLDNDIKDKSFVFIMANYFYQTNDGMYSPAEIAVAKFSFENGIQKYYHTFVNPETVTIGYAFEAKDRSEKVHRLPPPPEARGEKNFEKIYEAIIDILGVDHEEKIDKSDERRPCVFIRKQDTEMIESILDQLSYRQWRETFDVFELELLFNMFKNKVVDPNCDTIRITVSNTFIEQDRYDATPNISCDFHEKEDVTRHCSLSYVRRWFFLFCDHICQHIGVNLVPGKHLPENALLRSDEPVPFEDEPSVSASVTGYRRYDESDSSSDDY